MYFLDVATAIPSVRAFWDACKGFLPSDVTIQVENTGDELDSVTGALVNEFTTAAVAPVTGTSSAVYAAAVGALANWKTSVVVAGSRLRGKTFIVPVTAGFFTTAGALTLECTATIETAGGTLIADQSSSFVVWHRPVNGAGGNYALVASVTAPTTASVLRSRRD